MRTLNVSDPSLVGRRTDAPPALSDVFGCWWATDLALSDNDLVASWTDHQSLIAVTASGSARPTYKTAGLGGRPSVLFGGSQDLFTTSAIPGSSSGTVIAVASFASFTASRVIWAATPATLTEYMAGFATDSKAVAVQRAGGGRLHTVGDTTLTASTAYMLEWTGEPSAYTLRVNSHTESLSGGSNDGQWFDKTSRSRFVVGSLRDGGIIWFPHIGHIAYLLVMNRPITSGERSAVASWVAAYYGVT